MDGHPFTYDFLLGALAPKRVIGVPRAAAAISTDTRTLTKDALYLALKGERFDGHAFLAQALDAGAGVLVVSSEEGVDALVASRPEALAFVVDDTTLALSRLARAWRAVRAPFVVGITGSNGKTTTKELCAAILNAKAPTLKTEGNLNNQIGVPLTLLALREERLAVIEMGMNHLGEIAELAVLAMPDVALITNVGAAHLEGLGSIENVARAKGELFDALDAEAWALVNLDNLHTKRLGECVKARKFTCSESDASADVFAEHVAPVAEGYAVSVCALGERAEFTLPLFGRHNVMNLLLAIAAGLKSGVELKAMPAAVARCVVPGSRARVDRETYPALLVIEDCYNANPVSMQAALALLAEVGAGRRLVALLGDMLELGADSARLHTELGAQAAKAGVDALYAFGPQAELVTAGARTAHGDVAHLYAGADWDAYSAVVCAGLREGDAVLIKGSRGMRLERIMPLLKGRFARKD